LLTLAENKDSRRCFLLLEAILKTPSLADRLLQVLRPEAAAAITESTITNHNPAGAGNHVRRRTQ